MRLVQGRRRLIILNTQFIVDLTLSWPYDRLGMTPYAWHSLFYLLDHFILVRHPPTSHPMQKKHFFSSLNASSITRHLAHPIGIQPPTIY